MQAKSISGLLAVLCLAMAICALAAPAPDLKACNPGSFACDFNRYPVGIVVCDGNGLWLNAANCDPGQTCSRIGGVPHCV